MLRGNLVTLRPIGASDLPTIRRWFDDPETMSYWGRPRPFVTERQFEADLMGRFASFDPRQADARFWRLFLFAAQSGEGPLTGPTAAAHWRPRELVFVPPSSHSAPRSLLSLTRWKTDIALWRGNFEANLSEYFVLVRDGQIPSVGRRSEYPSDDLVSICMKAAAMAEHNSMRAP